jgi:hypothetical protein
LVNSETWIFASAVAMADFLLDRQTGNCTARVEFTTSWLEVRALCSVTL